MMKRIVGSLLLISGLAALVWPWLHHQPAPKTNLASRIAHQARSVILITTDTTRPDHLHPYGAEDVKTPVLQRLADEGILMLHAFSVAPLTLPAHTSIHTGLYPLQTGVRNNGTHFAPQSLTTLAERFAAHGYRTGGFVSAAVLERRYGLDQGFETFDDDLSKSRMRLPRMVADRPGEYTVAAASQWLDGIGEDQRFFLWVHFYDPHAAYNPPPPYRDTYRTRLYDGEIAYMDAQIGKLLAHPRLHKGQGLVVAVIGDHGESLGDHGENTHGILPYQSTLHVPWILWLDGAPLGLKIDRPVSQVDLAPTLLDLAGLDVPAELAGQSLLAPTQRTRLLYSESYLPFYTYGWAKLHVIRQGNWEYIDAPQQELYDLKRDPRELTNLAARRGDVVHDLQQYLADFESAHAPAGDQENKLQIDQQAVEKLRALGYLSMTSTPAPVAGKRPDPKAMVHLHTTLERSRSFISDRLYQPAVDLLRTLLTEDPDNLAAMAELANALQGLKQPDEAAEVSRHALSLDPDNQQMLMLLAQQEAGRKRQAQAIALADRVLQINPVNMSAWIFKTQLQFLQGLHTEATATLNAALKINPLDPLLNTLHAKWIELAAGDQTGAERRLRQASARDPFLPLPWQLLGTLLEQEGRIDEARAAYQDGLRHIPDAPGLHALLAVLLARQGDPAAEAHLREAIRRDDQFRAELYVSLGAELAKKGRLAEARALYAKVLERTPNHKAARNNRAIAMARMGQSDKAITELTSLAETFPGYADAHNNLALLLLDRGDAAAAERHARRAVALAPGTTEGWDVLGAALLAQGHPDQAIAPLDRALQLKPDSWSALLHRGLALATAHKVPAAQKDLLAALGANNDLPDAYYQLATLYAGQTDGTARARRYFRVFLQRYPDHPRAGAARQQLAQLTLH